MQDGWTFCLLGPLEVRHGGVLVPVAAAKQRSLIAVLALAAGEPVTVDRLIACLWDERPPDSARNTLHNYVMRLRRALQTATEPFPLVTSAAGYHLAVDADVIDVHRFRSVLRQARSDAMVGEAASTSALLDEALAMWRGEPLVDVPSDVLHREVVPGLVEQRWAAREERIDLDLQLGRHRELVTELVALTTAQPLRERIWAQLMLALYRCGRTAEALDAYRRASTVLADELGLDPGPELQRLHQAVLSNHPDLTITADPAPRATEPHSTVSLVVARQLPAPIGAFVGRTSELHQLSARLEAARSDPLMVISAICGTAGIGKTALAVHWGHLQADQFPDGQLYINLRGFDPNGDPVSPTSAVRGFLTALGVPTEHIPADPDEQIALYRSHLAGRRMLVVLDNARDAEQVRPLLPGAPGPLVLVTSRDQLASLVALDGAQPLTMGLFTHDEARDLLTRRLGPGRVEREQAVVDELIELCARLPLAMNIAAAHAALHPARPLALLADELREVHRRLDVLSIGESTANMRAVFSWSYRTMTAESARVFRLLGLHPGPDISLPAAASLAGRDLDATRHALDELTRAHLITERAPRRYTVHDLLRAYAADQAHTIDSQIERHDSLRRVVDFYLHTALAADHLLSSHRAPIRLDPPAAGTRIQPLPDVATAMAWFDAEHPSLLGAQHAAINHAWHPTVWQLAWSMDTFHNRRAHRHDRLAVWRAALDAAAHLPDPTTSIHAHRHLGHAFANLGFHEEGLGHLHRALNLAEDHHDVLHQAHVHHALIWAQERRGDNRKALHHATRALNLYRTLDQPTWEADALNAVGWFEARLGVYAAARTHCQAALTLHRNHHNPRGEADTLDSLGYIAHQTGRHQQAIGHYQEALTLFHSVGNTSESADTFDRVGHPHVALGEYEQAREVWQEALELYRQQGRGQDADRVRRQLDTLDHPDGRYYSSCSVDRVF